MNDLVGNRLLHSEANIVLSDWGPYVPPKYYSEGGRRWNGLLSLAPYVTSYAVRAGEKVHIDGRLIPRRVARIVTSKARGGETTDEDNAPDGSKLVAPLRDELRERLCNVHRQGGEEGPDKG